jgi:hypothetical protein
MFNLHHKSSESTVQLFISFVKHPDNDAIFVPNPPEKGLPAACPYCYEMGTPVYIEDIVAPAKMYLEFLWICGINVFFKREKNAKSMQRLRKRAELRSIGQPFT